MVSRAHKRAEVLCNTCILNKGDEVKSGYLTLPSRGPERGQDYCVTLAF